MNFRLLMVLAFAASVSVAAPITYSWKFEATATFANNQVNQKNFEVILTSDTNQVIQPDPVNLPKYYTNIGSATISIDSFGTYSFLNDMLVFVNPAGSPGTVGIRSTDSQNLLTLVNTISTAFSSYSLKSDISTTGFSQLPLFVPFETSGGSLIFTVPIDVSTFKATVQNQEVPEPATILMTSCAFAAVLMLRHMSCRTRR
ncbi:MAG: hypothetical protein ACK5TN_18130 [Acidobacteriota bacterium]|jgi:hypothetical protein